jgi:hypothetical protein
LKRGTKSLGKRSEFEALVQVKQTVNHSETTARSKFQKNKEKSLVDPSGGGETAGTLVCLLLIQTTIFALTCALNKPSLVGRLGSLRRKQKILEIGLI